MQNKSRTGRNKMDVMPIGRLLLSMAIPLMLSLLVQSLYNIVDSIFVARISEKALTAASLAYPIQILMIALAVGTSVGVNALLSRLLGADQREAVGKAAATGLVLALLSSLLFILAGAFAAGPIARLMSPDADPRCAKPICASACCFAAVPFWRPWRSASFRPPAARR